MAWEYYEFLGVHPSASAEDVKRACFRKRRELAVATDEDGLEYLNQVSETLLDERKRRRYDAWQEYGDEIAELANNALQAMERQAWADAIQSLKLAIALSPTDSVLQSWLGVSYSRSGELTRAVDVFRKLSESDSGDPVVWGHLGTCLLHLAGTVPDAQGLIICPNCARKQKLPLGTPTASGICVECGYVLRAHHTGHRGQLLLEARECYQRAIELEGYNAQHYIGMARTYEAEGRYREAASWVQRSIESDGAVDSRDVEAFCYLVRLLIACGRLQQARYTAVRMKGALGGNESAIRYGTDRFLGTALQALGSGAFDVAIACCEIVLILAPHDDQAYRNAQTCQLIARAKRILCGKPR